MPSFLLISLFQLLTHFACFTCQTCNMEKIGMDNYACQGSCPIVKSHASDTCCTAIYSDKRTPASDSGIKRTGTCGCRPASVCEQINKNSTCFITLSDTYGVTCGGEACPGHKMCAVQPIIGGDIFCKCVP